MLTLYSEVNVGSSVNKLITKVEVDLLMDVKLLYIWKT